MPVSRSTSPSAQAIRSGCCSHSLPDMPSEPLPVDATLRTFIARVLPRSLRARSCRRFFFAPRVPVRRASSFFALSSSHPRLTSFSSSLFCRAASCSASSCARLASALICSSASCSASLSAAASYSLASSSMGSFSAWAILSSSQITPLKCIHFCMVWSKTN